MAISRFSKYTLRSAVSALLYVLIPTAAVFLLLRAVRLDERAVSAKIPDQIDYNFHIRPILSDRCFKCHGPDVGKREAELRLDTEAGIRAALREDPTRKVIVPGDPEHSELYRRISATDTSVLMPPPNSHLSLNPTEIELIRKWIRQGAVYKKHWAFLPPVKPKTPELSGNNAGLHAIDQFIVAKQQELGLRINPEASREVLLRRVCTDLTGLPPSVELQDRFLARSSEMSYEQLVDELLNDPHYGEKMAISWLDVARYADSHGYQDDGLRTMWPWRDWVIHAFQKNYPYDQFVTWQLAGDLLPQPTPEQILATGFNRNHKITQEGGVIDEEYRLEYVTDRTNTFGKAFLALTYECAKCHDHKYDPISQKDFFSTFAFFNQVKEKGMQGDIFSGFPADPPLMTITTADANSILSFVNKKDTAAVQVMVMSDTNKPRITRVLKRGVYDQPADTVYPTTPTAVFPFDTSLYPSNRLGLARWLFSPGHPLTSRVFVNRIWQEFFGKGLVKSSGDFGMQGELPSHPELLDWLACDFRDNGWNIKRLVKQILMTAAYRQSAERNKEKLARDPDNRYLTYAPRLRLSAELLRDHVLASSGLLVREIGGPSVKPYQPAGIWEATTSGRGVLSRYVQDEGDKLYRRGMYTFVKRTAPPPAMLIFDASARDQCEINRLRTNTPLQALVMLNDPIVLESSRVLAQTLLKAESQGRVQVETAFRRILCRQPSKKEIESLENYHNRIAEKFRKNPGAAEKLITAGSSARPAGLDPVAHAALMETIHLIYNLEETSVRP